MRLFTLSDTPDFSTLNELYNRSRRIRPLTQSTSLAEVNAARYLSRFFDALIAELYTDPFFKQHMSHILEVRTSLSMQRSLNEVVTTLRQIGEALDDNYIVEQFSRDIEFYITHLERTLRYLKISGIVPKDKNVDPELNGIFVPLSIAIEDQTTEKKQNSIIEKLEQYPYVVLLGAPGSGKSTLVRQLAWSHAIANQFNFSFTDVSVLPGKPLPLRIELRRLTEDRRQHREYDFFSYASEVLLGREGIEINPRMFKELLERRALFLLFDGLDEVATLEERQRLIEEIEHIAQTYPGNHILVTSRPVGYDLARFSPRWFVHALIQDFDNHQIHIFLERWYTYVLRLSPLPPDEQQELEMLYTTLIENPRLHSLAVKPLLLTIITALHRYERLPDKRVFIYDRCADLLLGTWAKLKGTNVRWRDMQLSREDQYACIAHLGFVLHEREQEIFENTLNKTREDILTAENFTCDVPTRFMLREIERFLHNQNLFQSVAEERNEAKRFLELIQVESGLIVERGVDDNGESLYGFVHRIFQEYFAASDVYERYQQEADLTIISDFLERYLFNPHWHEVILLLFGKLKHKIATTLLRHIFEGRIKCNHNKDTNESQQNLFFICDCLNEEIVVENELAETVVSRLGELIRYSRISSEHEEAFACLGKLTKTRQYADLGQRKLKELLTEDNTFDVNMQIKTAQIPDFENGSGSEDEHLYKG